MNADWFDATNAWVTGQLGSASGLLSFFLLFLGGVLASLLPCVYPLYPITAAVLAKRESALGRFAHPLVYYVGLGSTYFAFGIVAALTGGSFNEALRLPAVNLGIGTLLFVLALATAGLLHFPALSSSTEDRTGFSGTFAMGAGAGLLSSACVGPVVVSILVSLASSTTQVSVGVALLAATKMMLFGFGVGLPLLLIGVFGVALPRGGAWMVRVQQLFGVLIAWFSLGYVSKGLDTLGYDSSASLALLAGIGLVFGAAFYFQDSETWVGERTKRSLLVVMGVVGFFVIGKTVLGGGAVAAAPVAVPLAGASTDPGRETHGNLTWYLDKESAYRAAAQTGKAVFVDFHGDWCSNCKAFQKLALNDPTLNRALADAILLKVRDTTKLFEEYRNDARFPELKIGLPFFLVTNAKEELLYKTSDYTKTSEMALFLGE